MRHHIHPWVLPGLLAALAAACGGKDAAQQRTRPPPQVAIARVDVRDVAVEVEAPVDLRPLLQAEVGSKTLGYLDAVLVDRGDRVRRGQLLALVRPSDLPDQLASAKGALAQARASRDLARANRDRARQLAPSGVVSQQELQQNEASLASADAQVVAAEGNLAGLATRLGETRLTSPLDGVVTQRRLDPGALVGPATGAVLAVARTDVLRAWVTVNERMVKGLAPGKPAWVEVDAIPGQRFSGKLVRMAPAFDPLARTLDVEIELPNRTGELRPGMYGRGAVVLETHPGAITVPAGAVQLSGTRKSVFVLQGDRVSRRAIDTGVDGGEWLEVLRGLKSGEEIVVAGADVLDDGALVRPARDVNPYTGEQGLRKADASPPPTDPPAAPPKGRAPPPAAGR